MTRAAQAVVNPAVQTLRGGSPGSRAERFGPGGSPGIGVLLAACPRPHAHTRTRTRRGAGPAAEEATARVEVAGPSAFWVSPGRQPRVPQARGRCRKHAVGVGRSRDPRGSAHSPRGPLQPHPSRVLGVSVRLSFFEETDSIFYREQAVFLFLYHFSDVVFTFAPILSCWFVGEGGSLAPVTPSGRVAGPGSRGRPASQPKHRPPAGRPGPQPAQHGEGVGPASWGFAPAGSTGGRARGLGPGRPEAHRRGAPRVAWRPQRGAWA